MSEDNNKPSSDINENNEVKAVIDNTNNFSNELHQLQDSLFTDNVPSVAQPDEAEISQNQDETNHFEANPENLATWKNDNQTDQPNESDDKQIIKISPETDEDHQEKEQGKQLNEDPERKIEVFNNITGLNQPVPQERRHENIPIKQRIANWYSSLEKRVGEAEAKESLVIFIRNASAFVVGSFFVSTIAEFIDNLK